MKNYHFWYSEKQANVLGVRWSEEKQRINYAYIDGKTVVYTTCAQTMDHGCAFDDMQYLGQGNYAGSVGTW